MDLDRLKLAYRNSTTNIWLVRATGGKFLEHFRQNGVVAIGHLDDIYDHRDAVDSNIPRFDDIQSMLLRKSEYTTVVEGTKRSAKKLNGKGTKKLRQIASFNERIKKGDIIVSTDGDALVVGICNGPAFFGSESVSIEVPDNADPGFRPPKMYHRLRREVIWGPRIARHNLPSAIKKTLQGQQTIIDLQRHWDKFYHLIYPFFVDENYLYISNKITVSGAVNNLAIGGLLQNVSLMQLFAQEIEDTGAIDLDSIARLLNFELGLGELSATTKAEFMSPGDLWNRIPLEGFGDKAQGAILCVALTLIMAGYANADEFVADSSTSVSQADAVSPDEMVRDIFRSPKKKVNKQQKAVRSVEQNSDELDEASKKRHSKKIKGSLALNLPTVDTRSLENFEFGIPAIKVFEDR
ncbi:hypothetical protein [Pseudomonas syringae]|uniref:hypothetical protein n=1 Tax=Pseudomonas syringae TaxID=317 RepID=UPI003F74AFF0